MIRLVFIDVDGTLVGSSGGVLPRVWEAADQARGAGLHLALCSGRPAFGVSRTYAARLDPDGWHVFQNGASIMHLGTDESRSSAIAEATVARIVQRARRHSLVVELYGDRAYAVERDSPFARGHAKLLGVPYVSSPFESFTQPVVRCQWVVTQQEAAALLAEPEPEVEVFAATSPIMPDAVFVNVTGHGVNKATALARVAAAAGVSLEEVMFVGDGMNDLEGMKTVGFPVAMGNGEPEVRRAARCVVGAVDDGGLAEALEMAIASRGE